MYEQKDWKEQLAECRRRLFPEAKDKMVRISDAKIKKLTKKKDVQLYK